MLISLSLLLPLAFELAERSLMGQLLPEAHVETVELLVKLASAPFVAVFPLILTH